MSGWWATKTVTMKGMYLHSAELKNAVTVTQNGSTFLLV